MRTIGIVTVGRSDYGMLAPVLRRIEREPGLRLHLIVSGSHLSEDFGGTVRMIEAEGWPIGSRVEIPLSDHAPEAIAAAIGVGVERFARTYAGKRPDVLVVLGDRFEMFAAAAAALPMKIPVAHIHGGELTQGAIDDAMRHAITKLSHLHFVATEVFAQRVRQLGEESWRVLVSGAPAVDQIHATRRLSREQLEARLGLRFEPSPLLATFHPVTLEYEQAQWQAEELVAALRIMDRPIVVTAPNEDTNQRLVRRVLEDFTSSHPRAKFVAALGSQAYLSLLAQASAMVGNSSSGLIEAPSFALPVVNIGTRQQGRLRAANVIDVGYRREEIAQGIRQALDPGFRARLKTLVNPYGHGRAAEIIVKTLRTIALDDRLLCKRFVDLPSAMEVPVEAEVAHVV